MSHAHAYNKTHIHVTKTSKQVQKKNTTNNQGSHTFNNKKFPYFSELSKRFLRTFSQPTNI